MRTLEEIQREVGEDQFKAWQRQAQREWEASPYLFSNPDGCQSYKDEVVFREYLMKVRFDRETCK